MGEVKGAMLSLFLIVAFIVPFYFMMVIQNVNQAGFFSVTQQVTDMAKEAGGINSKVADSISALNDRDINKVMNTYDITVYKLPDQNSNLEDGVEIYPNTPSSGNENLSKNKYGDVIMIQFKYKYKYMNFVRNMSSTQRVVVTKRTSENVTN